MVAESHSVAAKKKGKKRRISKHISNSKLKNAQDGTEAISDGISSTPTLVTKADSPTIVKKQKVSSKRRRVKDPTDVAGYLSAWKICQEEKQNDNTAPSSSKSSWKFNKNTQSWLIRHLYDGSKVSKTVFTDAMLYFGKANDAVQFRLRQEATMRALRYQQYIKSSKESSALESESADANDGSPAKSVDAVSTENSAVTGSLSDDAQWSQLDDHDRRKEYKRARKVLETLTVVPASSKNV